MATVEEETEPIPAGESAIEELGSTTIPPTSSTARSTRRAPTRGWKALAAGTGGPGIGGDARVDDAPAGPIAQGRARRSGSAGDKRATIDEGKRSRGRCPGAARRSVRGRTTPRIGQVVYLSRARRVVDGMRLSEGVQRLAAVEAEPEKFSLPRERDKPCDWIHVELGAIDSDEMRVLVEDAWRVRAQVPGRGVRGRARLPLRRNSSRTVAQGRAGRREAASSVATNLSRYGRSLRPCLTPTAHPCRRPNEISDGSGATHELEPSARTAQPIPSAPPGAPWRPRRLRTRALRRRRAGTGS